MKNIKLITVIFLLSFFLVAASHQNAIAGCLAVRLTVPAIVSLETASEAGSILKSIGGVIKLRTNYKAHTAELFFNDEKTSVKEIRTTLRKAGFPAKIKIKYIKISTFLT